MTTITDIQRFVGVPADGVIGPQTIAAIAKALGMTKAVTREDAFTVALAEVLRHEGGFVNHPSDPGGMTNLGVTRATWEGWTGRRATEADMRALTPEKVAPLYRKNYWDKLRCDEIEPALALCVFDFGVNAGPARAARYLQALVGTAQDGIVGPATLNATKTYIGAHGAAQAIRAYQDARRGYYRQLKTFATFGRGWLNRVDDIEAAALEISRA